MSETPQYLTKHIRVLWFFSAALIREKDNQLSALKTEVAFLNTEIDTLRRSEQAPDRRKDIEVQLDQNNRAQEEIRSERARLDGMNELD